MAKGGRQYERPTTLGGKWLLRKKAPLFCGQPVRQCCGISIVERIESSMHTILTFACLCGNRIDRKPGDPIPVCPDCRTPMYEVRK